MTRSRLSIPNRVRWRRGKTGPTASRFMPAAAGWPARLVTAASGSVGQKEKRGASVYIVPLRVVDGSLSDAV